MVQTLSDYKVPDSALIAETLEALRDNTVCLALVDARNFPNNEVLRFRNDGSFEFTTTAENNSINVVTPTETSVTVTAAKGAARTQLTHEAMRFRTNANFGRLGQEAGRAAARWVDDQIIDQFVNASQSVGTTTVDLTVAVYRQGIHLLRLASVPDPIVAILHETQIFDLGTDLLSATGQPYVNGVELAILGMRPPVANGFRGTLFGIPVYESNRLDTVNAGADYAGVIGNLTRAIAAGFDPQLYTMDTNSPEFLRAERSFAIYAGFAEREDASYVQVISDV